MSDTDESDSGSDINVNGSSSSDIIVSDEESLCSSSDGESDKCPICLTRLGQQDLALPDSCLHTFCLNCLTEWAKYAQTCPIDRLTFKYIIVRCVNGEVLRQSDVTLNSGEQPLPTDFEDLTYCEICHLSNREDVMLLCDTCDCGYHMDCLNPPLLEIPIEDWHCPHCPDNARDEHIDDEINVQEVAELSNDSSDSEQLPSPRQARQQRLVPRTRASERVRRNTQRIQLNMAEGSMSSTHTTSTGKKAKKYIKRKEKKYSRKKFPKKKFLRKKFPRRRFSRKKNLQSAKKLSYCSPKWSVETDDDNSSLGICLFGHDHELQAPVEPIYMSTSPQNCISTADLNSRTEISRPARSDVGNSSSYEESELVNYEHSFGENQPVYSFTFRNTDPIKFQMNDTKMGKRKLPSQTPKIITTEYNIEEGSGISNQGEETLKSLEPSPEQPTLSMGTSLENEHVDNNFVIDDNDYYDPENFNVDDKIELNKPTGTAYMQLPTYSVYVGQAEDRYIPASTSNNILHPDNKGISSDEDEKEANNDCPNITLYSLTSFNINNSSKEYDPFLVHKQPLNDKSSEDAELEYVSRYPVSPEKDSLSKHKGSYSKSKETDKKETQQKIEEIELYDVQKVLEVRPRRKKDKFGRDLSKTSSSDSGSRDRSRPRKRKRSHSKQRRRFISSPRLRSHKLSRSRHRSESRNRHRSRSRLRSWSRHRSRSLKNSDNKLNNYNVDSTDDLSGSAAQLESEIKFLEKLSRQERVIEEVEHTLKPHYNKKRITKEQYKDIMRKAVPQICHSKSGEINPQKILSFVEAYVIKYRHLHKKHIQRITTK